MERNNDFNVRLHGAVDRVLCSREFMKAHQASALLRCLFDMTLTHGGAASNDVAKHMSADGDKVRRLMLDLRKRLDKYYSLDGRNDELHIQIANKPYRLEEHGSRASVRHGLVSNDPGRRSEAAHR